METANSSEALVYVYQSTEYHSPRILKSSHAKSLHICFIVNINHLILTFRLLLTREFRQQTTTAQPKKVTGIFLQNKGNNDMTIPRITDSRPIKETVASCIMEGRINKKKKGRAPSTQEHKKYNINLVLLHYHLFRSFIITINLRTSVEESLVDPTTMII